MAARDLRPWLVVVGALLLTVFAYWPGLYGGYVFDDFPFVVDNLDVHVKALRLGDWTSAALSFPAGHQGRWLAMLSFALNFYFTGLNPFWMKLTNLGIHAANGVFAFMLLRSLFHLKRAARNESDEATHREDLMAAFVAAAWLVLPINLTAVLYVAQRLESLSNSFVLIGLIFYIRARLRHFEGRGGLAEMAASLVIFSAMGLLVKESAALLPLYALCVEIGLLYGRNADGRRSNGVRNLFAIVLGIPLVVGCVWLLTWLNGPSTYAREFTTIQRLLTEMRVLCDYVSWTLMPRLSTLTLFHDDVAPSTGLFSPISTAASALALLGLLCVGYYRRFAQPMVCVGILWFFAGHILTATIIPLELAFEHRNYFASLGLLLAACWILADLTRSAGSTLRVAVAACLVGYLAFVTDLRAKEWSDPLRLAATEASKRPKSSNAQYEYAHLLVLTARSQSAPALIDAAIPILKAQLERPRSSILPEQMLIELSAQAKQPIDDRWWTSLTHKLRQRPPSAPDVNALTQLTQCQINKRCPDDARHLLDAFLAALSHPGASAPLLSVYGDFAAIVLHDNAMAERSMREAVARRPDEPTYRSNLIRLLIASGELDRADSELSKMATLNAFGSLDGELASLRNQLAAAREPQGAVVPNG